MKTYPNWLVPLEIAKELKEIWFDEPCNHYVRISNDDIKLKINHSSIGLVILKRNSEYLNDDIASFVTIPTWEQVFEWFREKEIVGTVRYLPILGKKIYIYVINAPFVSCEEEFLSYEEAREALVNRLIKEYTEYEQAKKEWEAFPCDCCN